MATRKAIIDGSIQDPAVFGGTAPVDGDTIAFAGHTLYLDADLGAATLGMAFSGTGKFILKNGGRFSYLKSGFMSQLVDVQFGEPETPLPATGGFYGNAAAEWYYNGTYYAIGSTSGQKISAYTAEREGPLCAKVVSAPDSTHTVVDGTQEFLVNDILLFQATTETREVVVTGWDTGTRTITHAAIAAGCQVAGVNVELLSCPACIRKVSTAATYPCVDLDDDGSILYAPDGSLFVTMNGAATSVKNAVVCQKMNIRRLAASCNNGFARQQALNGTISGIAGTLQVPSLSGSSYGAEYVIGRIGAYEVVLSTAYPIAFSVTNGGYIVSALATPIPYCKPEAYYYWLRGVALPAVYIAGTLKPEVLIRRSAIDNSTDIWESAYGFAVKTQDLPAGTDLPSAYLLSATDSISKPFYDEYVWCKRGQTVRALLHYFVPASGAYAGIAMFDVADQCAIVSTPLASYETPATVPFFSWQIAPPVSYYNDTNFDRLIRIRAYGYGAYDVYTRIMPEIGGGPA